MARKYNKLSREALKMLLDGVSRREVKQYLAGKQMVPGPLLLCYAVRKWLCLNRECRAADKAQSVMKGVM